MGIVLSAFSFQLNQRALEFAKGSQVRSASASLVQQNVRGQFLFVQTELTCESAISEYPQLIALCFVPVGLLACRDYRCLAIALRRLEDREEVGGERPVGHAAKPVEPALRFEPQGWVVRVGFGAKGVVAC